MTFLGQVSSGGKVLFETAEPAGSLGKVEGNIEPLRAAAGSGSSEALISPSSISALGRSFTLVPTFTAADRVTTLASVLAVDSAGCGALASDQKAFERALSAQERVQPLENGVAGFGGEGSLAATVAYVRGRAALPTFKETKLFPTVLKAQVLEDELSGNLSLRIYRNQVAEKESDKKLFDTRKEGGADTVNTKKRSREESFGAGVKTAEVAASRKTTVRSTQAERSLRKRELSHKLVTLAYEENPQLRLLLWQELTSFEEPLTIECEKLKLVVSFGVITEANHYPLCFSTRLEGHHLEDSWCQVVLKPGNIEIDAFNSELVAIGAASYLNKIWFLSDIGYKWSTLEDWQALVNQMKADRASSYQTKLLEIINGMFQIGERRGSLGWIDFPPCDVEGDLLPRCLKVTYDYRPFHFQIVEKHPEQLGLPAGTKMLNLCFWTDEGAKEPWLSLNFLLDRPLMEIYSIHRTKSFSGSEAIALAGDIQEMLGVSTLLYDEAKIYDTDHKNAVTLLFWRSLSSEHAGLYEKRGFSLVDFRCQFKRKGYVVQINQKALDILSARRVVAAHSFSEFVQIANEAEVALCFARAASVLKCETEACAAMKVQDVADGILRALSTSSGDGFDRLICEVSLIEKALYAGFSRVKADSKIEALKRAYIKMFPGQFFVSEGYRAGSWVAPWNLGVKPAEEGAASASDLVKI